jgi:hypothetical protein
MAATAGGVNAPGQEPWFGATYQGRPVPGFAVPMTGAPNPSAAAVLGLIPGVGAMYNGQLFKGLIHVVIFAVLVSITDRYAIFGLFIAAWIFYQSFEAYHTAKARRDGLPVPDPFGLNDLGSWLNIGSQGRSPNANPGIPVNPMPPAPPPPNPAVGEPPVYNAPYTSSWTSSQYSGPASDPASYQQPGYPPYSAPWTGPGVVPDPFAPSNPPNYPSGTVPPIPPISPLPPHKWHRKEPIFAFVLIGLGIIFLLQSMGFVAHLLHYIWPVALIGLGVWLIMRRVSDSQGGPK